MSIKYSKSFTTDFSSNWKQSQFHDEIVESNITKTLLSVDKNEDVIDIVFDSALSSEEEIILNNLISNHLPSNINLSGIKVVTYSLYGSKVETSGWSKLLSFAFPGTKNYTILNFEILGYLMIGNSYDLRVQDITNNKTIVNKNFTNHNLESNDLDTINNLPVNKSIFEIQAKINSNNDTNNDNNNGKPPKIAYFDSLIIYYT